MPESGIPQAHLAASVPATGEPQAASDSFSSSELEHKTAPSIVTQAATAYSAYQ